MAMDLGKYGIGVGKGSLYSSLSDMLGFGGNAEDAAAPYYDQIPSVMHKGYDPYVDQGQQSMGAYNEQLQKLLSDPSSIMRLIGSQYKESPGFQHSVQAATQGAERAAAAGGQAGAPSVQEALADQISQLSSRDYGDYMNKALGLYGSGLSGEKGMTDMGFQASTGLAQNLADTLMSRGNLSYSGEQQKGADITSLLSTLGSLAAFL